MIIEFLSHHVAVIDLRSIRNELRSVLIKWYEIGAQLGVNGAKLREIQIDCHTVERCFSEMISFWFKGNTEVAVTWKSIIDALESPFVNEKHLANQLREKVELKLDDKKEAPSSTGTICSLIL